MNEPKSPGTVVAAHGALETDGLGRHVVVSETSLPPIGPQDPICARRIGSNSCSAAGIIASGARRPWHQRALHDLASSFPHVFCHHHEIRLQDE